MSTRVSICPGWFLLFCSCLPLIGAPQPPQPIIIGADVSSVQAAEARGVQYSDKGVRKDILTILKDHGFNYVRLRVFNDPTKATPRDRPYSMDGYCDLRTRSRWPSASRRWAWAC